MYYIALALCIILGIGTLVAMLVEEGEHEWWEGIAVFGFIGCLVWLQTF